SLSEDQRNAIRTVTTRAQLPRLLSPVEVARRRSGISQGYLSWWETASFQSLPVSKLHLGHIRLKSTRSASCAVQIAGAYGGKRESFTSSSSRPEPSYVRRRNLSHLVGCFI
ncbi:hypothetical protein CF319_g9418, partial [Tilletia indica]